MTYHPYEPPARPTSEAARKPKWIVTKTFHCMCSSRTYELDAENFYRCKVCRRYPTRTTVIFENSRDEVSRRDRYILRQRRKTERRIREASRNDPRRIRTGRPAPEPTILYRRARNTLHDFLQVGREISRLIRKIGLTNIFLALWMTFWFWTLIRGIFFDKY